MSLMQQASARVQKRIAGALNSWLEKAASVSGLPGWARGWIAESFPGAWQRNITLTPQNLLSFAPIFACVTQISQDVGMMPWQVRDKQADGSWREVPAPVYSAYTVLKSPNAYQNAMQFREWWVTSKLRRGNAYVLKGRDPRGVVNKLWVLDPDRVTPLTTLSGDIFYDLDADNINGLPGNVNTVRVPASEIIHDRMNCLFHPLVGESPLFAAALIAATGLGAQQDSIRFFSNGARPGGLISYDGPIPPDAASRVKQYWDENFTGENAGRVAILGDGAKFSAIKMSAQETALIEQLNMSAEWVCAAFHVPPWKVGFSEVPAGQGVEAENLRYLTGGLQSHIEAMELCLAEGLGMDPWQREIHLDVDNLLRMDAKTLFETLGAGVKNIILSPNEARRRINLPPVRGGDSPLAQQQNFSLEALAKRDAKADPFATNGGAAPPAPNNAPAPDDGAKAATFYCGAYSETCVYSKGDMVTYDGSLWHCEADSTDARPKSSDDWRMMVKNGEPRRRRAAS